MKETNEEFNAGISEGLKKYRDRLAKAGQDINKHSEMLIQWNMARELSITILQLEAILDKLGYEIKIKEK